ncbi:GlsB/YeaQ/YmgE family stress response membrane protein [Kingella sp. SNUBH-2017]|jgi:hypothetical protein|uniref:GlsB/YeaQ/YmgE family stress response membrane protein n=1 Tax=Kingella pumchi TaxID=2779506 RepID=A0ABS9NMQ6_9NEIS|nr:MULTISPECIES: GlsB/YeaQ/YmgE family stress response membrane protein [Kingella]MCG6504068.1 GlsB/YeaQ/YmgE family stress response membrane protein [Kingella pumchi]MDD2182364.1 GlsB/YeaQ/YmgE family stress response membrane protein [Kingella sp. SNUBH-2017]
MGLIGLVIVGFFIGLVARALMPGNNRMGFLLTSALGILGSVVAGFLGQQLGWYRIGEPAGFIASVFGALLIMAVVGGMRR